MTAFLKQPFIPIFAAVLLFAACTPSRETYYAYGMKPDVVQKIDQANYGELQLIQVGDVVSIRVAVLDPEAAEPYNMPMAGGGGNAGGGGQGGGRGMGYQVDKQGMVDIPNVGLVQIAGLSTRQARDVVKREVAKYLVDPWVDVVVLSYKVTFLGEVNGNISIMNERLTLFEGFGQLGGLPPTASFDRVWLIREENGYRNYHLLNVNDPAILQSEFYYLRNNDIVYVEPNKTKQFLGANAPYVQAFTLGASILALVLGFVSLLN